MTTSVSSLGRLSARDVCHLKDHGDGDRPIVGLFLFYGSWNTSRHQGRVLGETVLPLLKTLFPIVSQHDFKRVVGNVLVDETDESLQLCIGDDGGALHNIGPCPPEELPALAVTVQYAHMEHAIVHFVKGVHNSKLLRDLMQGKVTTSDPTFNNAIQNTFDALVADSEKTRHSGASQTDTIERSVVNGGSTPLNNNDDAVRLFIAGDRSGVGKSSICLGLLGSLVSAGYYKPSELAYIKPATQCEAPQLIETYCSRVGIESIPVGPVVYYKGFTRAFLAGETESSEQLLLKAGQAVDNVARGKRLVVIDGVGFPAVGSICGTDNVSIARATGYPENDEQAQHGDSRNPLAVLMVAGSGVGAAVDAFNLNATYFETRNVPVIGAIFNRLSLEGFYSLENCKKQVTLYFDRFQRHHRPFGFVPLVPEIAGDSGLDHVDDFFRIFGKHVNVAGIVEAATRIKLRAPALDTKENTKRKRSAFEKSSKRIKSSPGNALLTREQIEIKAKEEGAAPSA